MKHLFVRWLLAAAALIVMTGASVAAVFQIRFPAIQFYFN